VLTKVKITNFQSHHSTELDFHPGVNVVVGKSNDGKSALIRALLWLFENRPLGFRFHTKGRKGPTVVELTTPEGVVTLSKTDRSAEYSLDGEKWSSPGGGVPEQISSLLNLSEVNVQRQFDPHFLICSPPGEVGRVINQITRIEKVDGWISDTTSSINDTNREIHILQFQLQDVRGKLAFLSALRLDELKEDLEEVKKIEERIASLDLEAEQISSSVDRISELRKEMRDSKEEIERLSPGLEQIRELAEEIGELNSVTTLLERFVCITKMADRLEMDLHPLVEGVKKLDGLVREESLLVEVCDLRYRMRREGEELTLVARELGDQLRAVRKCPLCLSDLDEKQIERIERGYA